MENKQEECKHEDDIQYIEKPYESTDEHGDPVIYEIVQCLACGKIGRVVWHKFGEEWDGDKQEKCEACNGTGNMNESDMSHIDCLQCGGTGWQVAN